MSAFSQNELINRIIELNASLGIEKDTLRKLELTIELIHVKEDLRKLVGDVDFENLMGNGKPK
jgi:hypothetical protein